jgi:predicted RNase H-like nuclease (RuvC/YqgF family)
MGENYNKSIIKQLEELTLENELLKTENKLLKAENLRLWQTIKQLNDSIEQRISEAVKKACAPLNERISYLESENKRKDAEIIRLKAFL